MISISGVGKYFGDNKVLDNVDMEIKEGEIYGIIGHSGAGKSTLLRCLNGLESYQEGSVKVDGKEVKDLSHSELRGLRKNSGMIFQHFSLLERRTVFENIALPMECYGYSKEEIKETVERLMETVGISEKRDDKPRNLSGGQKQRVAIARALTLQPNVLLCDEATSALDPSTTKSILSLLEKINRELNLTIVVVTHQMEVIKQICSRVSIMEGGKVIETGDTEEIFLQNKPVLRKLLGEDQIVMPTGINIKILFPKEIHNETVITTMARELDLDVSIVFGKLEKFRDDVLGSLIINVAPDKAELVKEHLSSKGVRWEEVHDEI